MRTNPRFDPCDIAIGDAPHAGSSTRDARKHNPVIRALLTIGLVGAITSLRAQNPTSLTITFGSARPANTIAGVIFEDQNSNGTYDTGVDKPVANVGVSDGENVALSGPDGTYKLPANAEAKVVFICQPANFERQRNFYRLLPEADETTTGSSNEVDLPVARNYRFDFAVRRAAQPDPQLVRFVQTTDIHIGGEADRERFENAVKEVNALTPAPDFVVATGDLINTGNNLGQFEVYTSTTELSQRPWFHVFGNHDANNGGDPARNFRHYLGPDYYSADFADLHLVMLNSIPKTHEREDRWLEQDLKVLAAGKRILVFQHYPPKPEELQKFGSHNVRAVFSGHWHTNKITLHENGLANINHPTFIMGGIDGSPSSFRIVTINGERITSEFRYNDFNKHIWITYPQGELTGPERLLANIYDTTGDVAEARFRISTPDNPAFAGTNLARVSTFSWMAPLGSKELGLAADLPANFQLRVRATNNRGEQWETSQNVSRARRLPSAPEVKLEGDWPQFMRNAQRTGSINHELRLPLALRWFTPTHASIDYGSPVLYKGKLAIGMRDRDNLINNGVALLDAKTGTSDHVIKTDSAVNGSCAFVDDGADGPGLLYAVSMGGGVYLINVKTGEVQMKSALGTDQQRWVFASPAVQDNLTVVGNAPMLQALNSQFATRRWVNNFGVDWISTYASPSLAGPTIVMGAMWLDKDRKDCSIYGLNSISGNIKWTNECGGVGGSVAVANGRGYALDSKGKLKVIDLETGADIASVQVTKNWSLSTPAVDPETVIVPAADGTVHAYELQTLKQKWVFQAENGLWRMAPYEKTGTAVFSSPTIAGSLVFIGASDGRLYALDKASGAVRWFYDFGVPTLSTPCVSGNTLFTAAYDGNVYAFTGASER